MPTVEHCPFFRNAGRIARSLALPLGLIGIALGVLFATSGTPKGLHANGLSLVGEDYDQDGLPDTQEEVLGTRPDEPDSDGDGFSDLEEVARKSDPLSWTSVPSDDEVALGMYAHTNEGFLNLGTAIYVKGGKFKDLKYTLGVVLKGQTLLVNPASNSRLTRAFFYTDTKDPNDKILVLDHGTVADLGRHEQLMARGGLYRELMMLQGEPG